MEQAVEELPAVGTYSLLHLGKDIPDDEWRALMLEYYKALGKGRFGYSRQMLKMMVKASEGVVYELTQHEGGDRWRRMGSMGVEARVDPTTAKRFPSVLWLTLSEGEDLTEDLLLVVYDHLRNVAIGLGADCIMLGGRPGWFRHPAAKRFKPRLVRQEFAIPLEGVL